MTLLGSSALLSVALLLPDSVVLHNGTRLSGTITEYDERGVRLEVDGKELRYEADEVKAVDSTRSARHQLGQSSLHRRDFDAALSELGQARDLEKRPWAVREIDRLIYRSLLGKGDLEAAGKLYLQIAETRTDVQWLGEAPLVWAEDETIPDAARASARQWLRAESPTARLLAASWLIGTAQHEEARAVLDEVQTIDARVGSLARAQLWRSQPQPPTLEDLGRWRLSIQRMPLPIRAGPAFVLATAENRLGRFRDAAVYYLWVAYVYRPESPLAARSLLAAGQASMKAGMPTEGEKILQELVDTFPGSVWAMEAQKKLLTPTPSQESPRDP